MKTQFIIIIGILFISKISGQVQKDVNKVLKTKNFITFKKYSDSLGINNNKLSASWTILRDITTDFQEGVFNIEKSVPDKVNPRVGSIYTYRVTIIATKTKIVYYKLSEKSNRKVGEVWETYYETIDSFKDKNLYDSLKNSFKRIFKADLNDKELFNVDFVYGENCGFGGTNPNGRKQINEWVKNKNKTNLLNWLKSTNTEKQIYAVDGLLQLRKNGAILTTEELKIIKYVLNKNGTISYCAGCTFWNSEISNVVKEFKL